MTYYRRYVFPKNGQVLGMCDLKFWKYEDESSVYQEWFCITAPPNLQMHDKNMSGSQNLDHYMNIVGLKMLGASALWNAGLNNQVAT